MAIILNGISYKPYYNGPVEVVWVNGIKRWSKQPSHAAQHRNSAGAQVSSDQSNPVQNERK